MNAKRYLSLAAVALTGVLLVAESLHADPLLTSWLTAYSGRYARISETDAQLAAGTTETTWSRNSMVQNLPAYCGIQNIYSSTNWVYIRTTGLGSHQMGPWYNDATRTTLFVNIPVNQKALVRFPRTPTVPATKSTVGGELGYFVDGVIAFDSRDAVSYINSTGSDGSPPGGGGTTGDGIWNRDAYVNETITFDPALAHQQNTGVYHYHANPIATRYLLGDHVDFNTTTKTYSESTNAPTKHSPIVGWMKDGFPLYGPYGYSNPTNPASGVRRMISGFVLRNGQYGTTNLAATGRTSLPAWAARAANRSTTLASTEYGPAVGTAFPLGRYTEDNDYLGDLGKVQGVDFDLNEYNCRYCVTPEFPNGTYAYFVTITSNGLPTYPYNVGKQFVGTPTGGAVTSITETVTTNFIGGADAALQLSKPAVSNSVVTLTWSATEGGTYRVESSSSLTSWTTNASNIAAVRDSGSYSGTNAESSKFFRVARTALATYDPVSGTTTNTGGNGTITMAPTSGNRGSTISIAAVISSTATPPVPPQSGAPVQTFTVGTISVTGATYTYSGGQGIVTGTLTIPAGATVGGQTITITFAPPPGQQNGPTYAQPNGFIIN
jgi:YHYH protein